MGFIAIAITRVTIIDIIIVIVIIINYHYNNYYYYFLYQYLLAFGLPATVPRAPGGGHGEIQLWSFVDFAAVLV